MLSLPIATVQFPGSVIGTGATDINDAGTVVGLHGNPDNPPISARGEAPSINGLSRLMEGASQ